MEINFTKSIDNVEFRQPVTENSIIQQKEQKYPNEPNKNQQYEQLKSNLHTLEINLQIIKSQMSKQIKWGNESIPYMQKVVQAQDRLNYNSDRTRSRFGPNNINLPPMASDELIVSRHSSDEIALMRMFVDINKQINVIKDQMNALEQSGL